MDGLTTDVCDDVTTDDTGHKWTQLCPECVKLFKLEKSPYLCDAGQNGICGIKGCEKEADYYYDF